MSRAQRDRIRATLREAPQPEGPRTIEQRRAGFAAMMAQFAIPEGVRQTPTELAGRPAVVVEPEGERRTGTILYLHGGSFSLGSPQTAMALTAHLVLRTGMRAVSLDYRLAPEHPFPAGIEDSLAAYRALRDQEGTCPVVLAGDSAGGGLAVTTTLSARDAGLPLPAAVVCFSGGLDATRTGESMTTKDGVDPMFTAAGLRETGTLYVGDADPHQPLLAPAVCADMTGFPPLLLQVGTDELLLDDSVRLAARARDAEVDVVLDVTAGVPHVFQAFTGTLDEAGQALDRAALFITQHLAG